MRRSRLLTPLVCRAGVATMKGELLQLDCVLVLYV